MRTLLLSFLLFSVIPDVNAQLPCGGPGREPGTAEAVCGNLTFVQQFVSPCTGQLIPNPTAGCGNIVSTDNSLWYKFHCFQAGNFGFLLTPGSFSDDYDWEIMDITGHDPYDVYTMELRVSLNLSGQPGPTGCTAAGLLDVNCAGGAFGTQFNRVLNLVAGHDYLLMVNNYSNSGLGYTLDFLGTAVLTDNALPAVTNVGMVACDPSAIKVSFSEDILCNTITALGSEFTITNGTHVITGTVSNCSIGANAVPSVIINLQTPLTAGNYQLVINDGTDGNTFENVCRRLMLPATIPFTIPPLTAVEVDTITFTGCAPTVLNIELTKPVWCSSISPSGSEFSILPGNPAIASVQSSCSSGGLYTNQLQIVLQNPLPHGNYQLLVNNGTDGNTFIDTCYNAMTGGIIIPFVVPQITVAPVIQSISFDECHPDKVVLNFDKPVLCASLTATGTEFSISPGAWPINSITNNCIAGIYTSQLIINLQNPLPGGNFTVAVINGTDGNTLADTCYAFMPAGNAGSFTATQAPIPIFDSVQVDQCDPAFVKVFYSKPVLCSSISPDGSDYSITGPGVVNIISAATDLTCTQGYTNWVLLQLAPMINVMGNYVLHNGTGSDGNGIIDTCNARQNIAETILFNVLLRPTAAFNSQVNWGCALDTIVFSHPGGNGINSWIWNFSDGTTATGQNVSHIFPVTTPTVDVQLIVSNGYCSDTTIQTIVLGNFFNAAFINSADTFCVNTPVDFADASSGAISSYLWDFGDGIQFNGQNPTAHVYPLSNIYHVQLIVTDNYGCKDTAAKMLDATAFPIIDFTGLKPQYCTDNKLLLKRDISRYIESYTWNNGNGEIFTNEVEVNFSYPAEGVYTITLTGIDKYCGTVTVNKPVPVYAVPKVNLGADTVLCQSDRMLIGIPAVNNYTYLWNTGATSPRITTDIFSRLYSLTADNNGCRGSDAISIKVLAACLIKVPGAFTPNGDGLNDQLKALNADLAKDFSFKVFNRNGQLVFASNNPLDGWDGRFKGNPESSGTFVWMLSYIDPWNGEFIKEKGTSILLR